MEHRALAGIQAVTDVVRVRGATVLVEFVRDDELLVVSAAGEVRLHRLGASDDTALGDHRAGVAAAAYARSDASAILAVVDGAGVVTRYDLAARVARDLGSIPAPSHAPAVTEPGEGRIGIHYPSTHVAISQDTAVIAAIDAATGRGGVFGEDGRHSIEVGGPVASLAVSADHRWLATGSTRQPPRKIWLSSLDTEQKPREIAEPATMTDRLPSLGFADNALFVGGLSHIVHVVPLDDHPPSHFDSSDEILAVATATDPDKTATWIASAERDGAVRVHQAGGALVATLHGHTAAATSVRFVALRGDGHPTVRALVTTAVDGTARMWTWEYESGEAHPIGVFPGTRPNEAPLAAVSPSAQRIAVGDSSGTIKVWATQPGLIASWHEPVPNCRDHRELPLHWPAAIVAQPGGDTLAIAAKNGWSLVAPSGTICKLRTEEEPYINAIDWSPTGDALIVVMRASHGVAAAQIYDAHCKPVGRAMPDPEHQDLAYARFSPDGQTIVTVSSSHHVRRWARDGKLLDDVETPCGNADVAMDPHGRWFATAGSDGVARVWPLDGGRSQDLRAGGPLYSVAFDPTGTRLIAASKDARAYVWDVLTRTEFKTLPHREEVHHAQFFAGGTRILTSGGDGRTCVWDAATFQLRFCVPGHNVGQLGADVHGFAASVDPSGHFLVAATPDKSARIYDVDTGEELVQLRGHAEDVAVAQPVPCPDALCVVTAGRDNVVNLWRLTTTPFPSGIVPGLDAVPPWLAR